MKKFVLVLALIIANLGLNAQNVGSYIEVEYSDYILRYTVTSVSPAECAVANVQLTTETAINVLTIPASITIEGTEFSVTTIANEGFAYCYSAKKIEMPNTIKTIGNKAFYYCNLATEIAIPENVTHIGDKAFYCCPITEATIPSGVTKISNGVFEGCRELTKVEIPNSVTSIGNMAFKGCMNLAEIELPSSLSSINDYAFSECTSLSLVRCLATTPPACSKIFYKTPEDMIIRVPAEAVELYKSTEPWSKYIIRAIGTESIEENEATFNIYPNPVKDNIVIEANENIIEINIYNVTGALMNNVECTMNNVQFVNISDLNSGVYFVKVKTDKGEALRRIIKL